MSSPLPVRLEGLVYRVGVKTIIDRLDATITTPGITALIGPNGAGKSVTLRLIDGLLAPEAGAIRIGTDRTPVRRAFVFQRPAMIRASAAYNVALGLRTLDLTGRERRDRVRAALARVDLLARADDPATKLSGGEQQRLALARALAAEPQILLLDEPTASLDPTATEEIEALVVEAAGRGTKVLLVSHNLGQVGRLADDVIVLSQGRAVEHGPTQQVLSAPRTPEARAYIKRELPWTSYAAAF
ncbi:ATP-binding cassette domain-containing protein [Methylobacterium radiodurans]|uniref:ABC transporter ATP-binding protein n=1 Tax=Methylobacterium radiodurans TaxID=2202828 RepID=A0A2U8VXM2_9HYPH|nr:ATP-binding cassette domain-containing protein [Methylobacterium radiodurans]AWN38228.1 ABC transporter ATP-binding protein [Methylobacterium radiodurans]